MSRNYYLDGSTVVCIETGMPEDAVQIGTGITIGEARRSLESTPTQSVGRDSGEAAALRWAREPGGSIAPEPSGR